jgi:hypothetical protein
MEYLVIVESTIEDLEAEVMRRMADGWNPQGGVCAVPPWTDHEGFTKSSYEYFQAIIRDI